MSNNQDDARTSNMDRPILFSAPMVRAILESGKTQTRRVIKPQPIWTPDKWTYKDKVIWKADGSSTRWRRGAELARGMRPFCPYGLPSDRLWVRETWGVGSRPDETGGYDGIEYRADEAYLEEFDMLGCYRVNPPAGVDLCDFRSGWRPSIHMYRWASRITLKIVSVHVEQVQDISEADATEEGVTCKEGQSAADAFRELWQSINGKTQGKTWADNPYVWVVGFDTETVEP